MATRRERELAALNQRLQRLDRRLQRAFAELVGSLRSTKVVAHVLDRYRAGDLDGALSVIEVHANRLGAVLTPEQINAAQDVVEGVAVQVGGLPTRPAIVFDPTDAAAAAVMRRDRLALITGFSEAQRQLTRQVLASALQRGVGPREAAREFRNSIGLTDAQYGAVENYEAALRRGNREALRRTLRDRRFDPSVERAAAGGDPLSEDQIQRMVGRYRARTLAKRAEDIARTETTRAVSSARDMGMRQFMDELALPAERVEQFWNATRDGRTRDAHASMQGQVQAFGVPFVDGAGNLLRFPADPDAPAETTVNCRCAVTFRVLRA